MMMTEMVFADDEGHYYIPSSGVRNLTRATLDDVRQGDWLLVIVAQWCGYSRNIVGKLSAIAQNLKQAQVAVIDGEEDPSIHIQFSLDAYPFICYVHDGAIHVYDDIPEWEPVLKWASNGWKNVEPLKGPYNPFGWQMSLLGATTHFFWTCYDFVSRNAATVNIAPLAAFSIIFGVFTVVSLITVACCVARYDDTIVMPFPAPKNEKEVPKGEKPKAEKLKESKPKEKQEEEKPKEKPKEKAKEKQSSSLRQRKSAKRVE